MELVVEEQLQLYKDFRKEKVSPSILISLLPAKTTEAYDTYWRFAAKRQEIFFSRYEGLKQPWTNDPILQKYKFTNAYRASDRVSQYLIRKVIYCGDQSAEETFFRIMLFKLFNKIETWEKLIAALGEISYKEYNYNLYDNILTQSIDSGRAIYSAAYIMPSGGRSSKELGKKHRVHLKLLEQMMQDKLPLKLQEQKSMRKAFDMLLNYPMMGNFLAYQYLIDINYSTITDFNEMDFIVPGPGAKDGIRKCFQDLGGLSEAEIIKLVTDRQEQEFERLGIDFKTLWGRRLQLIDCQNLFCEVDKYSRIFHPEIRGISNRMKIKQKFSEKSGRVQYWYPPKWHLNEKIAAGETP